MIYNRASIMILSKYNNNELKRVEICTALWTNPDRPLNESTPPSKFIQTALWIKLYRSRVEEPLHKHQH